MKKNGYFRIVYFSSSKSYPLILLSEYLGNKSFKNNCFLSFAQILSDPIVQAGSFF